MKQYATHNLPIVICEEYNRLSSRKSTMYLEVYHTHIKGSDKEPDMLMRFKCGSEEDAVRLRDALLEGTQMIETFIKGK